MPARVYKGLECPSCGGSTFARRTGRANNGSIMLRTRVCAECGTTRLSVEVLTDLPPNLTRYDEELHYKNLQYWRAKHNYRNTRRGHPRTRDTLKVSIQVKPGKDMPKP